MLSSSPKQLQSLNRRASHHILSAVDRQRRAGDGARLIGREEHHRAGDFVGLAEAIDRDQRQDAFFQYLLRHCLHHLGIDVARADRVHRDAALGILQRQRLGEADVAGLRRRIIDLTELAFLAVDRGDVDDAAERDWY